MSRESPAPSAGFPPYLRHRFPTAIVKHDADAGMPLRDERGFCVPAEAGEAGEAIGRIGDGSEGSGRFEGYTDSRETERKILRNVFEPGDACSVQAISCAAMRRATSTLWTGSATRSVWKGENVSTLEVANVLAQAPGVNDAVVYGVAVPGADGKAGMAFLDVREGFDLSRFLEEAAVQLPGYALPLFLRIGKHVSVTETFKHRKQDLMREGFDPSATDDPIYVRLPGVKRFTLLDTALFR